MIHQLQHPKGKFWVQVVAFEQNNPLFVVRRWGKTSGLGPEPEGRLLVEEYDFKDSFDQFRAKHAKVADRKTRDGGYHLFHFSPDHPTQGLHKISGDEPAERIGHFAETLASLGFAKKQIGHITAKFYPNWRASAEIPERVNPKEKIIESYAPNVFGAWA